MSRPKFLTKEDLRQFLSCEVKPLYRWARLESKNDQDPFLRYLAQEGRSVGRTARRLFRNLVLINERFEDAERTTRELISIPSLTLAEAAFCFGPWRIRPDILSIDNETISIFEVKAKTISLIKHHDGKEFMTVHGEIRSAWREILFDLAMQVAVLEMLFPERRIEGRLVLPVEEIAVSPDESTFAAFGKESPAVGESAIIEARRIESVLRIIDPGDALDLAKALVIEAMVNLEQVRGGKVVPEPSLHYRCRNCEYRLGGGRDPNDGYHQCWRDLAQPFPHLFDLHQLYQIGGQASFANQMIEERKTALLDASEEDLRGSPYAVRQQLQLQGVRTGKEWLSEELGQILGDLEYPLRFLDFETSMNAIPRHPGLKPYELLPIQFSQHSVDSQGNLAHEEWLHATEENPILPFARSLLSKIGDSGHILIYTDYEIKGLRSAIDFLRRSGEGESEAQKLENLLGSGRIIDQHDILYRHFHHPQMGGRTSLKVVAKAIWMESEKIRNHPWFGEWGGEKTGPYDALSGIRVGGKTLRVADGCGAMKAYAELERTGMRADNREKIRHAMLRYCELDTLVQVMVFTHWKNILLKKTEPL